MDLRSLIDMELLREYRCKHWRLYLMPNPILSAAEEKEREESEWCVCVEVGSGGSEGVWTVSGGNTGNAGLERVVCVRMSVECGCV